MKRGFVLRLLSLLLLVAVGCSPAHAASPIEHVITYAQSLAGGMMSIPAPTRIQPQDSLMFNGGVRTPYDVADRPSLYASLVPLVEADNGIGGETPTAGTLEMIKI